MFNLMLSLILFRQCVFKSKDTNFNHLKKFQPTLLVHVNIVLYFYCLLIYLLRIYLLIFIARIQSILCKQLLSLL